MASALRRRLPLILLVLVCLTPAVGPYLLWHFWQPSRYSNYGELVEPRPLPASRLVPLLPAGVTPPPTLPDSLRGRWFLVSADGGACDEHCERKLYHARQLRTMQGKEMERVERVWVVDDAAAPAARLVEPYAGTLLLTGEAASAIVRALPVPAGGRTRDHLYLVDPLGNVMMRYPRDAEASRIHKDLVRLLKYSRIG